MFADLDLNDKGKIRVYNIHLQSNQFSKEDYEYLENIGEESVNDQKSLSQIVAKLKKGYIHRAEQTLQVQAHKNNASLPSIICGDFNDTPISFSYKTLSSGMKDGFIEKGSGFGKTFQNPTPFLRIDYALFDPSIDVLAYQKIQAKLSDHYPIIVNFKVETDTN
jgi:endonuclease/exonuclease/phosphatase family metal-dependent hydrolase